MNENKQIDENDQIKLLEKMLSFYKKRYSGKELDNKFNNACDDMYYISSSVYSKFCIDNRIEPIINKNKYNDDINILLDIIKSEIDEMKEKLTNAQTSSEEVEKKKFSISSFLKKLIGK